MRELTLHEAIRYAAELNNDGSDTGAYVWYRWVGNRRGWWIHGRQHDLGGTDYYGFKPISIQTAYDLYNYNCVGSMSDLPGHPRYETYYAEDTTQAKPRQPALQKPIKRCRRVSLQ